MHWNTFGGSVAFAAIAGAGVVPAVVCLLPSVGAPTALAAYLVGVTILYAHGLAPGEGSRIARVVLPVGLGLAAVLWPGSLPHLVFLLAAYVGVMRSGVFWRTVTARAVAIEVLLIGGGLLLAQAVGGGTLTAWALGVWAFLLVQSVYFLIGGVRGRPTARSQQDAFDAAYGRALALLERRDV